jgi:hypothetical protein
MNKRCKCGENDPQQFSKNSRNKDGLEKKCRKCLKIYRTKQYQTHKKYYLGKAKKQHAENRKRGTERHYTINGRFAYAKSRATQNSKTWSLSFEQYRELLSQPCYYCANTLAPLKASGVGLDRINNAKGYELDNVLSCCGICNSIRNDHLSVSETIFAVQEILRVKRERGNMNFAEDTFQILHEGTVRLLQLPKSDLHKALQEAMGRVYADIQTLRKLNSPLDYQAFMSTLRGELESCVDIQLLLIDPNNAQKINAWEFCAKAKSGNRILDMYGNDPLAVPPEMKSEVDWAINNQSTILQLKNKYNLKGDTWHGGNLGQAILSFDPQKNSLYMKTYLKLYSMMNWGTHGSGAIIQNNFSAQSFQDIIKEITFLSCEMAMFTMIELLNNPKIKFCDRGLLLKAAKLLNNYKLY